MEPPPSYAQTSVAQPVMVASGKQTVHQLPAGQVPPPGQQPIQHYTPAPGQSLPTAQQPVQYYMPAPAQFIPGGPVNRPQKPGVELTLEFAFLKTQIGVFKCIEFVSTWAFLRKFQIFMTDMVTSIKFG